MTVNRFRYRVAALAAATILAVSPRAGAQGILSRIKDQAKQKIDQKVDESTDSATTAAVNKAAGAVTCAATNSDCIKKAASSGHPVQVVDAHGQPVTSADSARAIAKAGVGGAAATPTTASGAESQPPGSGAWLNYDFIPGDKVLFYDDFASDRVGDLPAHLDVTYGNATVVDIAGTKYLRTVTGATTFINLPQPLPQRFTIEVKFHRTGGNGEGLYFKIGQDSDNQELDLRCDGGTAAVSGRGADHTEKQSADAVSGVGENDFQTCRYMVDSGYVKVYVNNQRVGQLNGLSIARGKKIELDVPNADDNGTLITDIRIAEGGKPLYDALATSGRVSTHGILFATGSDQLQPESTPTLTEIGQMLQAHADLKLEIEGHTDNVGNAVTNQSLSDKRAKAVMQYLISKYQINPSRLTAKGYGDTKPAGPNTTAEGRQINRRVELVKV